MKLYTNVHLYHSKLFIWRVSSLRFPHILETSVILYIYVENNLAHDSSIYTSTGVHSSTCDAQPEARPPETQERLHWVCTCLQFGISCSFAVYYTDQ